VGLNQVFHHPVPNAQSNAEVARVDRKSAVPRTSDYQVEAEKMTAQLIIRQPFFDIFPPLSRSNMPLKGQALL
jgi:hypothetical protein